MQKNNIPIESNITINDLAVRLDKTHNTVEQLTIEMRKGFADVNKNIEMSIEEIAGMIGRGFKDVDVQFAEMRDELASKATTESVEHLEDKLGNRIDTLENLIVKDHGTRIRRVERKLQLA